MTAINPPSARMSVFVGQQFACVKIAGRANFSSSIDFRTLLNELLNRDFRYFVLDLSECLLMDSTFLGVLAGFGLKLRGGEPDASQAIELLNPNVRISELLENLGVLHLFKVTQGPASVSGTAQPLETCAAAPTKTELTQACLEAHQTLMQLDPANLARFKDLTQFLAEDLKKLKAGA